MAAYGATFCYKCGKRLVIEDGLPMCEEHGILWSLHRNAVCADAIIVNQQKEVLLVKRANEPHKGMWGIPGGFTDYGEHPKDTVAREVLEETGYEGHVKEVTGIYIEYCPGDKSAEYRVSITYEFYATKQKAQPDSEVSEVSWFKLDDLPKNIPESHMTRINDYVKNAPKA